MTTEEKEGQEFSGEDKVYVNPGMKPTTHVGISLGSIIGIVLGVLLRIYAIQFCEWLYDVALANSVNNFRNLDLGMIITFSAVLVVYLIVIFTGYSVKETVLGDEGVVFRRKLNPIVIQRLTEVKEISGGRVLRLTGLTPEGKTVKKRVSWADVGRNRWGEFKKDLEKIKSGN